MLAVEGLSKSFGGVAAIQDVSLKFAPGSLTAIIGPNGAGKTTFFNLISGAIRPDKGRVTLSGEDIVGLPPAQIARRGGQKHFELRVKTQHGDRALRAWSKRAARGSCSRLVKRSRAAEPSSMTNSTAATAASG